MIQQASTHHLVASKLSRRTVTVHASTTSTQHTRRPLSTPTVPRDTSNRTVWLAPRLHPLNSVPISGTRSRGTPLAASPSRWRPHSPPRREKGDGSWPHPFPCRAVTVRADMAEREPLFRGVMPRLGTPGSRSTKLHGEGNTLSLIHISEPTRPY